MLSKLILLSLLLTGCQSYYTTAHTGTELKCELLGNHAVCQEQEILNYEKHYKLGYPEPQVKAIIVDVAKIVIIEVAKSMTVEMIKDAIYKYYVTHYGLTDIKQITLLKSH